MDDQPFVNPDQPESSPLDVPVRRGGPQIIPRPELVEVGPAPAWAHAIGATPGFSLADVAGRLTQMSIDRAMSMVEGRQRRSAVAVVLSEGDRGPELLLTRRAWHMRTHKGEIAFPGGGEETGDLFPVGTALREACEEVRLDPDTVAPLGALDPMVTFTSDKAVVPVVFSTEHQPDVVASPEEVDAILNVSIAELLEPGCYRTELWTWNGSMESAPERGYQHPVHFFELYGDTLWGATASMVNQLLTVLFSPDALDTSVRSAEVFGR